MNSTLRHSCARAALLPVLAASFAGAASAQEEAIQAGPGTEDRLARDEIVITGSFIRGTPEDAALPVDVFSSEDLAQSGTTSPLEFIKELPSVGSVLGDQNQYSTFSQGFQGSGSINLRGLGEERTLVLVNGKRFFQSPGDGFTDTNLIPLFALERVEILKDGAAATYGSDAIGGVANFITRKNFEGVELAGDWTFIDGSDDDYSISAVVGQEFGTANIVIGAGWQHRSELPTFERDFAVRPFAENPSAYSALSTPGTYAVSYFDTEAGAVDTRFAQDAGCEDIGGTNGTAAGLPICRFSFIPFNNLVEESDRYQVYGSVTADLSDTVRASVEAIWSQTDLESLNYSPSFPPIQGPNGSGFVSAFSTSPANPFVPQFLDNVGLPQSSPEAPLVAVTNVLYRPFGWLGNPTDRDRGAGRGIAKNDAYRVVTGLEADLSENLTLQTDFTYWRFNREFKIQDIVGTRFQNALNGLGGPNCDPATGTPGAGGCVFLNPFTTASANNPSLGLDNPFFVPGAENSEELINFVQPFNGTIQREEQYVFDVILAGETGFKLGGGAVGFALGGQYRKNEFSTRPTSEIDNLNVNPCFIEGDQSCVGTVTDGVGSFIFLGGGRPSQNQQDIWAVFAEANLPFSDTLELSLAARYEDYGDPVGSTFNPKGSLRWEATDWLVLRGSVGTTFRGPLAGNIDPNFVTALQGLTAAGGNFKAVDIFGNPDLDPETALTYNAGIIIDTGGLTASVDFWTYEFEDQITITPAEAIANLVASPTNPSGSPVNCSSPVASLITFSGNACVQGTTNGIDIARVRTQFVNGPDVTVRGFDFAINYDIDAGFGVVSLGGQGTYNMDYDIDDFEVNGVVVQPGFDAVGFGNYFREPGSIPEWRANAYVNVNTGGLNARYTLNYIDGVFDERCENVDPCDPANNTDFGRNSGSYVRQDLALTYDFAVRGADFQLQGVVKNIFDEDPPVARLPISYNPFLADALGRHYQVGLKAKF
ncbi:MAG: TonB-dependent receptor [Pacificimonas sp.]